MKQLKYLLIAVVCFSGPLMGEFSLRYHPGQNVDIKSLSEAMTRYYSAVLDKEWEKASTLVFGVKSAQSGKRFYYPVDFPHRSGAQAIEVVSIISFTSHDARAKGYLAVCRFRQSSDPDRFSDYFGIDAWFRYEDHPDWEVSPGRIQLKDHSFDPVEPDLAGKLFLDESAFLQEAQKVKKAQDVLRKREAELIHESRKRLQESRNP